MKASVIIPTYKRREQVLEAVKSLGKQTCRSLELIVVDNSGDPELREQLTWSCKLGDVEVRYVLHPHGGSSGARNRGALEATGELLIYGDDDLTFGENWVGSYIEEFDRHPEMAAAGGCVRPAWEEEPPQWLEEFVARGKCCPVFALMDHGGQFSLSSSGYFFSCNMAIRKDVLIECGGFRPELFGRRTTGSGEWGVVLDLRRRGELIGYVPGALAHHRIPRHRMTLDYIRQWAWHGAGCDMFERWRDRRRTPSTIARELLRVISRHWRQWLKARIVGGRSDNEAVDLMYSSSRGTCELNYIWWVLTQSRIRNDLDRHDFLATCS